MSSKRRLTYWSRFGPETYLLGDGAIRDKDGYLWIVGRIDDVITTSPSRPANLTLVSGDLRPAADAIRLSTVRTIKQNLAWGGQ